MTRAAVCAVLVALAVTLGAASAHSQLAPRHTPRIQPEARADFIGARTQAAHVGAGVNVAAGTYVRLGLVGAAGYGWTGRSSGAAGRVDGLVRFLVDPLRQSRWAPYGSGGIGALYDDAEGWRAVLVGVLGVEGPAGGGVTPSIEVGFGGGARVGLVLRRAIPGRR